MQIAATPTETLGTNTTDLELAGLSEGAATPAPSLALTDGDFGDDKSDLDTSRSTLLRYRFNNWKICAAIGL